jgi:nanoRNase/pAp phosphatase (c-di-AMP/oligoRNAs hydrolase)
MSLSPTEQFSELARKAEHPIILLPSYPSKDALAAGFALFQYFRNSGKSPTIAGENFRKHADEIPFLTAPDTVLESLSGVREFVLVFNTGHNDILETRSERDANEFRIFITPANGTIDPRDFSFIPAQLPFDIAFVIGSPDRESLGRLYEENSDIFYEIPVVNIDHKSENEQFGQVNIVDLTASSVSEIMSELLEKAAPQSITEGIAECLLAGIMSATESFQKKNTTPKSLHTASHLMERGADREKLVLHLYKTQPLSSLRLWGRVMSNLKWDEPLKLAYAQVTLADFIETRSKSDDLPHILEKIRNNFSSGSLFLVFYPETTSAYRALLKSASHSLLQALASRLEGATVQGDILSVAIDAASPEECERLLLDALGHTTA